MENKNRKKKHTKASLNLYLVAGLYLLYVDYSLIAKWSEIEANQRIVVGMAALAFAVFAIGIMAYAIKGLAEMKKKNTQIIEDMRKEEEEK